MLGLDRNVEEDARMVIESWVHGVKVLGTYWLAVIVVLGRNRSARLRGEKAFGLALAALTPNNCALTKPDQ
jgi:hypothetical protein